MGILPHQIKVSSLLTQVETSDQMLSQRPIKFQGQFQNALQHACPLYCEQSDKECSNSVQEYNGLDQGLEQTLLHNGAKRIKRSCQICITLKFVHSGQKHAFETLLNDFTMRLRRPIPRD